MSEDFDEKPVFDWDAPFEDLEDMYRLIGTGKENFSEVVKELSPVDSNGRTIFHKLCLDQNYRTFRALVIRLLSSDKTV